jgi:hypothetical protein
MHLLSEATLKFMFSVTHTKIVSDKSQLKSLLAVTQVFHLLTADGGED